MKRLRVWKSLPKSLYSVVKFLIHLDFLKALRSKADYELNSLRCSAVSSTENIYFYDLLKTKSCSLQFSKDIACREFLLYLSKLTIKPPLTFFTDIRCPSLS